MIDLVVLHLAGGGGSEEVARILLIKIIKRNRTLARKLLMMRKLLIISLMAIFTLPSITRAKDIVNWQNVNWPPFQILRGEEAGKGRFDVLIKIFQDHLPQYEHQNIEMNWARFWEGVNAGKHVLNSMAIKTEERSQYTEFSDVMTFTLPHRIIMKKSTIEKLGNPESVTLAEFLKDGRIKGILEQKRSYSAKLDGILKEHEAGANYERKTLEISHILKMILSDRIDYTIEYPLVVNYLIKKYNLQSDTPLGSIQIEELPRYITAHIAGPKNSWGINVINDINPVIDKLKTTKKYLKIHQMWHSDQRELDQIREIYEELFLK